MRLDVNTERTRSNVETRANQLRKSAKWPRSHMTTEPLRKHPTINPSETNSNQNAANNKTLELMLADFWAGYLSGAIGIVIGNPLDVVKVRLQAKSPQSPSATTGWHGFRNQFESTSSLVRG